MARDYLTLEPTKLYRAVILRRYPGLHTMELKHYTHSDGTVIPYHRAEIYGPYGVKGPATSQIKRDTKYSLDYGDYLNGGRVIPEIDSFVEECMPVWGTP